MPQISTAHNHSLEVLEHLVKEHTEPVTLIVCRERREFFAQILDQVVQSQTRTPHYEIPSSQQSEADLDETDNTLDHALLTASLQLLSISKSVKLVYCPTVPTLRACLASFPVSIPSSQLIVLDVLALHHGTSEFTLQGLSRTFASAVSTAHRISSSVTLVECEDVNDLTDPYRGSRMWNAEVPLLSGSVKIGLDGARWAGRSMAIRKIASRWFTFQESKHPSRRGPGRPASEDEGDEMLI